MFYPSQTCLIRIQPKGWKAHEVNTVHEGQAGVHVVTGASSDCAIARPLAFSSQKYYHLQYLAYVKLQDFTLKDMSFLEVFQRNSARLPILSIDSIDYFFTRARCYIGTENREHGLHVLDFRSNMEDSE